MASRRCAYCGNTMVTVRIDAKFCTQKCGTYYRRKLSKLPSEMTSRARFVRWKLAMRRGKETKVPLTVDGRAASSTDSATWSTFNDATNSGVGKGFGFVLGEGIGCIDLDHCIKDGVVAEWAQDVLDANPHTFVEVSQSGTGLHVFGLLDEGPGRKIRDGRDIEWYSVGRYIALTGARFGASPSRLEPLVLPA